MPASVEIAGIHIGAGHDVALIAGPCVLEEADRVERIAEGLLEVTTARGVPWIFKASFDKANRTSGNSYRGPGLDEGLAMLTRVRDRVGCPITTDVHLPDQAAAVGEVVDLLQVPAFLCRQTDLIEACGATGRPVNLKKGQFATVEQMRRAADKALGAGAAGVLVTERGSCFGHGDLVVDYRQLADLRDGGLPTVFDATHSTQRPGGETTGGERRYATDLARAALAIGVDAIFAEVHDDPARALSDASTQLPLDGIGAFLDRTCVAFSRAASGEAHRRKSP